MDSDDDIRIDLDTTCAAARPATASAETLIDGDLVSDCDGLTYNWI